MGGDGEWTRWDIRIWCGLDARFGIALMTLSTLSRQQRVLQPGGAKEDRTEQIVLSTADGHLYRGVVEAVGVDHVVVIDGNVERYVAIAHIVAMEGR